MPELRVDPIVGRRVYIAEDRAGRPSDYAAADAGERGDGHAAPTSTPAGARSVVRADCFFCAGNEWHTPVASHVVNDAEGRWLARVVPNKYPAVTLDAPTGDACGAHEVIIESPQHVLDFADLGVERLAQVLTVFRDRLRHWASDDRLRHAVVFKNSGYDAGASLEHVHSQLVALPYVPAAVQAELDSVASYRAAHGRCVFCDLIAREIAADARVALRRDGYVAVCAYAPRQPLETWILPERHQPHFEDDRDAVAAEAAMLHELLRRLDIVSPGAPYNLLLHTAPWGGGDFHWHWELVPRLTHEAGLEWGAGVYITPLSPERAAEQLRAAL